MPQRDLLLITGIPGTGKTTYGDKFASEFGFAHYDLEEPSTVNRCANDPKTFMEDILRKGGEIVVTWGFVPDHQYSLQIITQFRNAGFKLVWLDGDRDAALKKYIGKSKAAAKSLADFYWRMYAFYLQMFRIENTKIVEQLKPTIINPFNAESQFKQPGDLLDEIKRR